MWIADRAGRGTADERNGAAFLEAPARAGRRIFVDNLIVILHDAENDVGVITTPPPPGKEFADTRVGEFAGDELSSLRVRSKSLSVRDAKALAAY